MDFDVLWVALKEPISLPLLGSIGNMQILEKRMRTADVKTKHRQIKKTKRTFTQNSDGNKSEPMQGRRGVDLGSTRGRREVEADTFDSRAPGGRASFAAQ